VGYSSHFIRVEQFQEGGGDNLDLQELEAYQNSNNYGEVNSTNEIYKQHDKETKIKTLTHRQHLKESLHPK
jgi:hypothetical protein